MSHRALRVWFSCFTLRHVSWLHDEFAHTCFSARTPFHWCLLGKLLLTTKSPLSHHLPGEPSLASSDKLRCYLLDSCLLYFLWCGLPPSFLLFILCYPYTLPSFTDKSLLNCHFLYETFFHDQLLFPRQLISSALFVFLFISFIVSPSPECLLPEGMDSGLYWSLL